MHQITNCEKQFHSLLYLVLLKQPSIVNFNPSKKIPSSTSIDILWKSFVFRLPSLSQISLDFYLHEVSSRKAHLLYSSLATLLTLFPIPSLSLESQKSTSLKLLLAQTLPLTNTSLFQIFKSNFNAFYFAAKIKL